MRLPSADATTQPVPPDDGVILMTPSLKPIAADPGAAAILAMDGSEQSCKGVALRIPESILSLLRKRKSGDGSSGRTSVRIGTHQYICRTYLVEPQVRVAAQPMLLLHLQRDTAATDAVYQIAADYELSLREKEVLLGLALGLSSKEVAERMKISPNTVKAYVRLIMIKLGVTKRTAIVGKLLEYNGGLNSSVTPDHRNGTL